MEAKERRKRKDPESRDFTCLCGKSYLSYAAAYTHAKNKHNQDKTYIDGIQKPQREQLKRGRPKEKKISKQTTETAKLTLIESSILKICDQLQGVFSHAVLQGNEERNSQQYQQHFKELCAVHAKAIQEINMNSLVDEAFMNAMIKDFNAQVAAKVRFACTILQNEDYPPSQLLQIVNNCNLWHNHQGINDIIIQSKKQWQNYENQVQVSNQIQYHQDYDLDE